MVPFEFRRSNIAFYLASTIIKVKTVIGFNDIYITIIALYIYYYYFIEILIFFFVFSKQLHSESLLSKNQILNLLPFNRYKSKAKII